MLIRNWRSAVDSVTHDWEWFLYATLILHWWLWGTVLSGWYFWHVFIFFIYLLSWTTHLPLFTFYHFICCAILFSVFPLNFSFFVYSLLHISLSFPFCLSIFHNFPDSVFFPCTSTPSLCSSFPLLFFYHLWHSIEDTNNKEKKIGSCTTFSITVFVHLM